jgi:hypothetical protein
MKYKSVLLSESNYNKLKNFGSIGSSFNDAVGFLIAEHEGKLRNE